MTRRILSLASLAVVALAACTDPSEVRNAEPTAPALRPSLSVESPGDTTAQLSSVCLMYRDELQKHQATLAADPADQEAEQGAALYQARFHDACE